MLISIVWVLVMSNSHGITLMDGFASKGDCLDTARVIEQESRDKNRMYSIHAICVQAKRSMK